MLLTLTSTAPSPTTPASDLGYLLHKHPGRHQTFEVAAGNAHVFYPEAADERCTAALLLEVDPIALVRGRRGKPAEGFALGQYVNDRPYAASSLLAVALARVFRTAMSGRCEARPELAATPLHLTLEIPALPCSGSPDLARRLFAPLGWDVEATPIPADPAVPDWGDSPYVKLRLTGIQRLADALHHVYVLLPVLDDAKHYWVGPDEVEKLVRAGTGWLATHPERELITRRYLAHQGTLVSSAVARLAEVDDAAPEALDDALDAPRVRDPSLAERRRQAVLDALRVVGASRVLDLGCGEGALVGDLLADPSYAEVVGVDVSPRALEHASRRLKLDRMPERQKERLRLFQSSLTYRDERLRGFDAAVLMEVVEHVDPGRLPAVEAAVFGAARPGTVVVTTPNAEYNVRFAGLTPAEFRHHDHRFEWTRAEFHAWARGVAERHGYTVRFTGVGEDDPEVGAPTQLAVFGLDGPT